MTLETAQRLPALPGTYILWIQLDCPLSLIVGQRGAFELAGGWYAYVGSARGPGGLRARVERHLRREKTQRWHIDALTVLAPVRTVWFDTSSERLECPWAQSLAALPGVTAPIARFGSSDCACPTHLLAVPADLIPTAWKVLSHPALF
jgi:Uri superfamily endonuclease